MRFISFRQYAMLVNAWKKERAYQKKVNPPIQLSPKIEHICNVIQYIAFIFIGYKLIDYGNSLYNYPIFKIALDIWGAIFIIVPILYLLGIKINK
jgi:hypothetical protein